MKRFFITVLFVSLFITICSVLASGDDKKDKAPAKAKVENVEKKDCCATQAAATTSCCSEKKDCCATKSNTSASCCAEKKVADSKKADDCCTNKTAASETKKSSGKKAN